MLSNPQLLDHNKLTLCILSLYVNVTVNVIELFVQNGAHFDKKRNEPMHKCLEFKRSKQEKRSSNQLKRINM